MRSSEKQSDWDQVAKTFGFEGVTGKELKAYVNENYITCVDDIKKDDLYAWVEVEY